MRFNAPLLRDIASTSNDGSLRGLALAAADCIEALEAELEEARTEARSAIADAYRMGQKDSLEEDK